MQSGATSLLIKMVIKKDGAVGGRSAGMGRNPSKQLRKLLMLTQMIGKKIPPRVATREL